MEVVTPTVLELNVSPLALTPEMTSLSSPALRTPSTVAVVLVDPDAGPGVERPYTGGWIEPGNVHEIIDALWAAAATPPRDEVAR